MHVARGFSATLDRDVALFAVVVATVAAWAVFTLERPNVALQRPCKHGTVSYSPSCNAQSLIRNDPYCVLDPTCVSWGPYVADGVYWQGVAIVVDPATIQYNPVTLLSPSNFGLFMCATLGLVWVAARVLVARARQLLLAAITTWYLLEVARWFEALWRFARTIAYPFFALDPATYLALAIIVSPLGLTYKLWWPTISRPAAW